MDLIDIVKETYAGLDAEIKNDGPLISIQLKLDENSVFYYLKRYEDGTLTTNEISILPDQENEKIFKKIVEKNELIAKKSKAKEIYAEALTDMDKDWLIGLGYIFEDKKYGGIKKLQ